MRKTKDGNAAFVSCGGAGRHGRKTKVLIANGAEFLTGADTYTLTVQYEQPPPPLARAGRRARPRIPRRIRPNPPNADGRAEKRFPCCAGLRDCFPPPLARAFGEFAPRAESGLRGAGRADADGGEPAPREPRENRP